MKLWRVVHRLHEGAAWSGEGARLKGGRWNSSGRAVVYASEHAALALLEILVQVTPRELPLFHLVAATLPDDLLQAVPAADLPASWDAYPHTPASQRVGDAWLDAQERVALRVPSTLVPGWNILVNPRHAQFRQLAVEPGAHAIPYALRAPGAS